MRIEETKVKDRQTVRLKGKDNLETLSYCTCIVQLGPCNFGTTRRLGKDVVILDVWCFGCCGSKPFLRQRIFGIGRGTRRQLAGDRVIGATGARILRRAVEAWGWGWGWN